MMAVEQISVFVQNEKGALSHVLDALGAANIEIRALSIADTSDFGILRMITDNNKKAQETLKKENYICTLTDVVAAAVDDRPGGLANHVNLLAAAGIDVEYLYAFVTRSDNEACVVFRVNDTENAQKLLEKAGIRLVSQKDIENF